MLSEQLAHSRVRQPTSAAIRRSRCRVTRRASRVCSPGAARACRTIVAELVVATDVAGVETHPPHHGDQHLDQRRDVGVGGQLAALDRVGDRPGHERPRASSASCARRGSARGGAAIPAPTSPGTPRPSGRGSRPASPPRRTPTAASSSDVCSSRLGHACGNHQLVGLLDHLAVQHALAGEVVVDRGTGQIGTDGDCLECRCVVTEFAENLARGTHDALTRLRRLRCGRASWTSGRGIRHGQIVPHVTWALVTPIGCGTVEMTLQQTNTARQSWLRRSLTVRRSCVAAATRRPRNYGFRHGGPWHRASRTSRRASTCCPTSATAGSNSPRCATASASPPAPSTTTSPAGRPTPAQLVAHWHAGADGRASSSRVQTEPDPRRRIDTLIRRRCALPHGAEAAIRVWSSIDPDVRAVQAAVDQQRFDVLFERRFEILEHEHQAQVFAVVGDVPAGRLRAGHAAAATPPACAGSPTSCSTRWTPAGSRSVPDARLTPVYRRPRAGLPSGAC